MFNRLGSIALLALVAGTFPLAAPAQDQVALTTTTVHVRAGPSQAYPIVAVLPASYQLTVVGCLGDYTWCDVISSSTRGWVYAGYLSYPFQNSQVPVLNYGPAIGIAALAFVLDDYWDRHYRDRSWYPQRHRYIHRPMPPPRFEPAPPHPGAGPRPHPAAPIGPRPAQPPPRGVVPRIHPQPQPQPPGAGP